MPRAPDVMNYVELQRVHRAAAGRRAQGREVPRRPLLEDRLSLRAPDHGAGRASPSRSSRRAAAGSSGSRSAWRSGSGTSSCTRRRVALARDRDPPAAGGGLGRERAVRHARALPLPARAHLSDGAGAAGLRRAPRGAPAAAAGGAAVSSGAAPGATRAPPRAGAAPRRRRPSRRAAARPARGSTPPTPRLDQAADAVAGGPTAAGARRRPPSATPGRRAEDRLERGVEASRSIAIWLP